jgi:hypothetical protein
MTDESPFEVEYEPAALNSAAGFPVDDAPA